MQKKTTTTQVKQGNLIIFQLWNDYKKDRDRKEKISKWMKLNMPFTRSCFFRKFR